MANFRMLGELVVLNVPVMGQVSFYYDVLCCRELHGN